MKTYQYCTELSWQENWQNWVEFLFSEKVGTETILFVYEDGGVATPNEMRPIEVANWLLCQEYTVQDDQWPSRRWLPDRSEYIDLSGIPDTKRGVINRARLDRFIQSFDWAGPLRFGQAFYLEFDETGKPFSELYGAMSTSRALQIIFEHYIITDGMVAMPFRTESPVPSWESMGDLRKKKWNHDLNGEKYLYHCHLPQKYPQYAGRWCDGITEGNKVATTHANFTFDIEDGIRGFDYPTVVTFDMEGVGTVWIRSGVDLEALH